MAIASLKIVFVGDSGVGKTSMLTSYMSGAAEKYAQPTVGSMFMSKQLNVDGYVYTLQVSIFYHRSGTPLDRSASRV